MTAEDRATLRGVIGVPLEWRGRIIGACVVFSRDERRVFGPDDADRDNRAVRRRPATRLTSVTTAPAAL